MVREHGINFTPEEWKMVEFFATELGFKQKKAFVHAAILEYSKDRLALIEKINTLYPK